MYTVENFKTKKALKEAFKAGRVIKVFQPGPFGPEAKDGSCCIEGPQYPQAHSFYVTAVIKDGKVVKLGS